MNLKEKIIEKFIWNIPKQYNKNLIYKLIFGNKERYQLYFRFEKTVLNFFIDALIKIINFLKIERISYNELVNSILKQTKKYYNSKGQNSTLYIYTIEVYNNTTDDLLTYKNFFSYDEAINYLDVLIQEENTILYMDAIRKYKTEINLSSKPFIQKVEKINDYLYISPNKRFVVVRREFV